MRDGGPAPIRRWLWWCLAVATLLAVSKGPVYRWRFEGGPLHGDFVDDRWVQATFLILYLPGLSVLRVLRERSPMRTLLVATVALPATFLLSSTWSVDRGRAIEQAVLLSFGTLAAIELGRRLGPERLLSAGVVALHIGVALALFAVARHWYLATDVNGKWAGIYFNRNSLANPAGCGLVLVSFSAARWLQRRSFGLAAVGALLAGVDLYVLAKTASMSPLLGLLAAGAASAVAGLSVAVLRRRRTPPGRDVVGVSTLLAGALVVGWRLLLAGRPHAERIGRSPTIEGRTFIWYVVRSFIHRRWVGGWGLNAVWTRPDIHYAFLNFGGGGYDVNEAHNGVYEVLLGGGLLAAAALAITIVAAVAAASRWALRSRGPLRLLPVAVLGYVAAVNLIETFIGANLLPWTLLLAVTAAAVAELAEAEAPDAPAVPLPL